MEEKIGIIVGTALQSVFILTMFYMALRFFSRMFRNIYAAIKGQNTSLEPCRSCGHKISKEAAFCPYCGQSFGEINSYSTSILGNLFSGVVALAGGIGLLFYLLDLLKNQ
ncbi:zinc ribbon domain-containing protein [Paenibacillus sp. RRE4]|uniref:zinc ribbon domain-containing protein n=1 Tax=Paenibacillus sp. RRE4 TaxID=2962587 RepID=UPI002881E055|nr:zinc ribbon domain-containing protein [Paenibacillus sp. RRE4]MDT0123854.1 zinc ribbon domain-containing protein [Paenibacillus sp. RRE4]